MPIITHLIAATIGGTIAACAMAVLQASGQPEIQLAGRRCLNCRYFDSDCGCCFRLTDYQSAGNFRPLAVGKFDYCSQFAAARARVDES